MSTQPVVSDCAVSDCSYNHDGCQATAMTMGTKGCSTFIALPEVGGLGKQAAVGACQKSDCSFNEHLECRAPAVKVGGKTGECLTYHQAA
ncbi:hypothetical protein [Mobiluncus curtisii]|uniref:DUF1540 domain-containing protein n=1 Tax=Mobiluncus curtisii ATCC 51333 TaxID=887326 RepID=E6LZY8_9ACTO|nr:hypothetical protein [Mobiluncus curtisii]EFU79268.1 hypothetical protein HMPREF0388_1371 [Mobiluncus curtisii ATCC 51333]